MGLEAYRGVGEAQVFSRGVKLEPGTYRVQIKTVKSVDSRELPGVTFFIAEFDIVSSSVPDVRPAGMACTWTCNMSKPNAKGNVRAFIAAAMGHDPNNPVSIAQVGDKECLLIISDANPLAGQDVTVTVQLIQTKADKAAGRPASFPLHTWSPG